MKVFYIFLASIVLFLSCSKNPSACILPENQKAIDTVKQGTVINFDAGCSLHATKFQWQVISESNPSDSNTIQNTTKYFTYTFIQPGLNQIRLTASKSSSTGSIIQKFYYVLL